MTNAQDGGNVTVTVYNAGTALIHDQHTVSLDAGSNIIILRDIAKTIDPTSVNLRSLNDPDGLAVLEQSFIAERNSRGALLARFLGETVSVTTDDGTQFKGELLRVDSDVALLRTGSDEVAFVKSYDLRSIQVPSLPDDLHEEAGLRLLLNSARAGNQELELTYLAGDINWTADYSLFLAADESSFDLNGKVTLRNDSGRDYSDVKLKLVAGEVSRIEPQPAYDEQRVFAMSADADLSEEVEQRGFSEYQLYEIGRPVTIHDRETKQIEFISGSDIAAKIAYIFDSSPSNTGYYRPYTYDTDRDSSDGIVLAYLEFDTGAEQGLGADMPAGRIRVYKADADGAGLLIGESQVKHTPEGEAVALQIGKAFDLTGERIRKDFTYVSRLVAHEKFEIRLRNRKADQAVEIIVPERLYRWRDWQIIESSLPFVKVDSASIEFAVALAPDSEEVLTYTVRYSFPEED